MKKLDSALFSAYWKAVFLYPPRFRREYREQIIQTVRDAWDERRTGPVRFWLRIFRDLFQSTCWEHWRMLHEQSFKRSIILHALFVGLILTVLGGIAAITMQQMLRRGADQPQMEMADLYAAKMNAGEKPTDVLPAGRVDLRQSLEPFVIFYNDEGNPERSSGYLNQTAPVPPPGVFLYLRSHGTDQFTWQPTTGVRIAAVARRVTGAHGGFLLVGRSLRLVEESESLLRRMTFLGWFILLLLLTSGAAFLHRARQIAFS